MYGDEESGIPPEELYDAEDSREALSWTIEVLESVSKLFKELTSQEPI
jgi:HEPN domain-containing protein